MRKLKKQDRTSSRLPTDTERKYKLGQIELTAEELDKLKSELVVDEFLSTTSSNAVQNKTITNALNNKVTKENGKGLSTNDFTNSAKNSIHTHSNKAILDTITQEKIDVWNGGVSSVVSALDVYPIGSIYMSVNSTSPATLFGGTWEQLQDRFLLGAGTTYTNGTTGGEETHTLTIEEMPKHSHNGGFRDYSGMTKDDSGNGTTLARPTDKESFYDNNNYIVGMATGGNKSHNNMPPYLVVYMWKRVS